MRLSFDECVLDTETYRLTRGGHEVAVEPQVFDMLRFLAENAGKVVTKDELVDAIWNGRAVSEATISARVSAARSAVGDTGGAQAIIRTVVRRGFEMVVPVETLDGEPPPAVLPKPGTQRQKIRYTTSGDGTQIAYATSGDGPPLMWAGPHITHLELNWQSPIWRKKFDRYGAEHTLVRYDIRGDGLSEPRPENNGLDDHVADMAAVATAAGIDRFPMIVSLQGAAVAFRFIELHPDRVTRLVVHCGYARGRAHRESAPADQSADPSIALLTEGWGDPENGFMRAWLSMFLPRATTEELTDLVLQLGAACQPDYIMEQRKAIDRFNSLQSLPHVTIPTLVIHPRNCAAHPLKEAQLVASGIRNAEMLLVEGGNVFLLPSDPTWDQQMDATMEFIDADR